MHIDGGSLQVFVYGDSHSATNEAALVSPDGSKIGNTIVEWAATPHFYQTGKMIVIYVGDDDEVKQALEKIVGFQFAGR